MQRYKILGDEVSEDDPRFSPLVAAAYAAKDRPRCLCRRTPDLQLYISRRCEAFVLSRWPGTGALHAPQCDHYEAPDILTGLGQVLGSAIVDDTETGETLLKFGFPLTRGQARGAPSSLTNDKPGVKAGGQRLTMRGFLHYLWDRAELTHWHPRMAGKRSWQVVRRELMSAAAACRVKGDALPRFLFVPEAFNLEHKDEIARRRRSELETVYASRDALMVLIGEIKAVETVRFEERVRIRHLPDLPFVMDAAMARRFHKRFVVEEQLWAAKGDDCRLVLGASFAIGAGGLPQLFDIAVMPVMREWIPFETLDEFELVTKAVAERRHFTKGLRLNAGEDVPIISLSLTDIDRAPVAVHLGGHASDQTFDEARRQLMQTAGVDHVSWAPGDSLPAKAASHT